MRGLEMQYFASRFAVVGRQVPKQSGCSLDRLGRLPRKFSHKNYILVNTDSLRHSTFRLLDAFMFLLIAAGLTPKEKEMQRRFVYRASTRQSLFVVAVVSRS
jgi:hypothetical protein